MCVSSLVRKTNNLLMSNSMKKMEMLYLAFLHDISRAFVLSFLMFGLLTVLFSLQRIHGNPTTTSTTRTFSLVQ